MIIVRLKVNRTLTAKSWKEKALGTIDAYGNPFRIIKVQWLGGPMHPNTEYAKTRGFEDAIIGQDARSGGFKVTYRRNGSIMWQRPEGGIGRYYGEVADTPYNRKKLASCYADKRWTIVDADIEAIVKAMYEKKLDGMSMQTKEYNAARVQAGLVHRISADLKHETGAPLEELKQHIDEEKRKLAVRRQEVAKKEAELAKKEEKLVGADIKKVKSDITPIVYSDEYLNGLRLAKLKSVAKELDIKYPRNITESVLRRACKDKQSGKEVQLMPIPEHVEEPKTTSAVVEIIDDEEENSLE